MDTPLDPLLPAFHILWNAAVSEFRKNASNIHLTPKQHKFQHCKDTNFSRNKSTDKNDNQKNPHFNSNFEAQNSEWLPNSEETVVVCTMECDQGDKFTKQVIYEGTERRAWERAEDLFVDWLNCEVTSQRAEKVDVTIYFCSVPICTTSDGILLWMKNLVAEGKEVNIKIKVASLGDALSESPTDHQGQDLSKKLQSEREDTVCALMRLVHDGVHIGAISSSDWRRLMEQLTDRSSLQILDLSKRMTAKALDKFFIGSPVTPDGKTVSVDVK